MQMMLLGVGDYFNMFALPSLFCAGMSLLLEDNNFFSTNYYKFPWEITADMFGGVNRSVHTDTAKAIGEAYLKGAELLSNVVVKPMMLPVYTTAAALLDSVIPGLGTTLLSIMYTS